MLMKYDENGYSPLGSQTAATVYLFLEKNECLHCDLLITIQSKVELFIDGKYIKRLQEGTTSLSVDSLSRTVQGRKIALFLHASKGVQVASVMLQYHSKKGGVEDDVFLRQSSFFRDFSILCGALLAIWFVILVRSNQRAFLDYFNFVRLFSISERDDSFLVSKLTTSFNLVIYLFTSTWVAYLFLVINFHADFAWRVMQFFPISTFAEAWLSWLFLSAILFVGLLGKLFLLISFSSLFKLTEVLGLQFLNFVRLLTLLAVVLCVVLTIYLLLGINAPTSFEALTYVCVALLLLWLPILGLKLLRKASYRLFHLFSYLCPAEIFPVLLLIKALIL